jgi:hypothetical protein
VRGFVRGDTVCAMRVRGVASVVVVTLVAAGCGGAAAPRPSEAIHLNGKSTQADYVVEANASGARFLVPAGVLAGQGSQVFDVAAPTEVTVGEPANTTIAAPPPYRVGVASTTAVVPHSAHVELLVTGDPGRRFAVSWEETCGGTQHGTAASGGVGGGGLEVLRSPAVALVKLPRITGGVASCYLAATAGATTFTRRVQLAIIDY